MTVSSLAFYRGRLMVIRAEATTRELESGTVMVVMMSMNLQTQPTAAAQRLSVSVMLARRGRMVGHAQGVFLANTRSRQGRMPAVSVERASILPRWGPQPKSRAQRARRIRIRRQRA